MKIKVINIGAVSKKLADANISDNFLAHKKNDSLLSQVIRVHRSNKHIARANTLDRSEVSGGGKKPWKQKGTGRARAGSSRSPLWKGGGVTFGPNAGNNFILAIPKKMRQLATRICIGDKLTQKNIFAVNYDDKIKRADFIESISGKLTIGKKILLITDNEPTLYKLTRNIPYIQNIGINSVNAYDVMNNEYVLLSLKAMKNYFK